MPNYKITAAHKVSGRKVEFISEANSEEDAELLAYKRGLLVQSVELVAKPRNEVTTTTKKNPHING